MTYYVSAPYVGALNIDGRCLSVCPVSDPKSRTEGHGKLKIDRKEAYDTRDP